MSDESREEASDESRGGAYDAEQFDHNYPDGIQHHYWSLCRNQVVARTLRSHPRDQPILEIGCGRGVVVADLRRRGFDCWGCDLGDPEPIDSRVAPYLFLHTDAGDLGHAFRDQVSALLLLDVLEHLDDPRALLALCRERFYNARRLTITLPARQELWTNYDEHFGHVQRYDIDSTRQLLRGFDILDIGYYFHALYPAMRAVSALDIARRVEVASIDSPLWIGLHRAVGAAFDLEARLVPRRVPGSSLWATVVL